MSSDGDRPLTRREARALQDAGRLPSPAPQQTEPAPAPWEPAPQPSEATAPTELVEPVTAARPTGPATPAEPARPTEPKRSRTGAFLGLFAIVAVVLAVLGAAGAAIGTAQGPRVTNVQVDPAAAVEASGSRLIVTTSQSLATLDETQVTIEPAVPFAVDTAGRALGVRFGLPLDDDTEYTVTFRDVEGLGGGPAVTFSETFRTPPLELFLLQRSADGSGDAIFRTDLTGEGAVKVFEHERIEDFRATARHLVISVGEGADTRLIATDLDGGAERDLPLPGAGVVAMLQAADRGERIGYTFSSADPQAPGALESVLFTTSLADADAEPQSVQVGGADPRVAEWRFVSDTDSILLLAFDGSLLLTDPAGESATALGAALALGGVAGTDAIVERLADIEVVDLADGSSAPLVAWAGGGLEGDVLPVPGGGTLRTVTEMGESGLPTAVRVVFVADDGSGSSVLDVAPADALLQTCVSPSGRYAAVAIAPDIVDNPYDLYDLPLPEVIETYIVDITTGEEIVALAGTALSWCRVASQ